MPRPRLPYRHAYAVSHRRITNPLLFLARADRQASIITSVRALPTSAWSEACGVSGEDNEECSLCMERFEAQAEVRTLQCKHYFHTECIDHWLVQKQVGKKRVCPLCNHPVV